MAGCGSHFVSIKIRSIRGIHLGPFSGSPEEMEARFSTVLTRRRARQFHCFAAKVPKSVSPDLRKSKKSNPEYLHVWHALNRMRYSSIPFGVERPSMARAEPSKRFDRVLSVVVVPRNTIVA
jgi:hypothetical protein